MNDPEQTVSGNSSLEVSGPGGIGAKLRGMRITEIVCVVSLGLLIWATTILYQHDASAKDSTKEIARAIEKASTDQTRILEKLTEEQKKTTAQQSVANCLLALPLSQRSDQALAICERIVGVRNAKR